MNFSHLLGNITDNATDYIIAIVYCCVRCKYISKNTICLHTTSISQIPNDISRPVSMLISLTGPIIILLWYKYVSGIRYIYQHLLACVCCTENLLYIAFHFSGCQIQNQFRITLCICSFIIRNGYLLHFHKFCRNSFFDIAPLLVSNQHIIRNKFSSQSISVIDGEIISLPGQRCKFITASIAVI